MYVYIQYTFKSTVIEIRRHSMEHRTKYTDVKLACKQERLACETVPYECVSAQEAEQRLSESVPHWDQHLTHQLNPIQPLLKRCWTGGNLGNGGPRQLFGVLWGVGERFGNWPGSRCGSGFRPQTQSVSQLVSQTVSPPGLSAFSCLLPLSGAEWAECISTAAECLSGFTQPSEKHSWGETWRRSRA